MRKKISINDLKIGMFIDKFCGSWMDHPFLKSSFLLKSASDLKSIRNSKIREVWIDTSKGKDIEPEYVTVTQAEIPQETDNAPAKQGTQQINLEDELHTAQKVLDDAKQATTHMFQEARMGRALELETASTLVTEISESVFRNNSALLSLARLKTKDDYTYLHSVAVCALMIALGKQLGFEGKILHSLGMAGMLHDIGKVAVPDEILNKPGKLTDEEFEIIKTHPLRGWEILKTLPDIHDVALDVCLHHHERVDGTGYPDRLSGEDFSVYARMGAICDVYDAITSNRAYKSGWEPAESIRKMAEWKDGHFDEKIFQAFVKTVGIYPAGTLVKLKSGRLAVVTDQSASSLLTPKVKVFFSSTAMAHIPMKIIDLSTSAESIESVEDPKNWKLDIRKITGI